MSEKTVLYQRDGHIALITLNRPKAMNALDTATSVLLREIVDQFEADDDAWVAVLAGKGRVFSAGGDLKEALGLLDDEPGAFYELPRAGLEAFAAIKGLRKPVIAAVHGVVMAAGLMLANACHLIVASKDTRFGMPETGVGMPTMGYIDLWRTMGPRRLMEAAVTAEPFDAEAARDMGLVNRVVPEGEHLTEALALAERIATNSPRAVQAHVEAISLSIKHSPDVLADLQHAIWDRVVHSEDIQEGLAAFRDRRSPKWRNQ